MTAFLRYTNPYGDRFYLAELGDTWPHRPGVRFVQRTVTDPEEAMVFDTPEDAAQCLAHKMAAPPGWEVVGG